MQNTTLHFAWAQPLAQDIASARHSILLTALSMHPPRSEKAGNLAAIWQAIAEAVSASVRVDVILPSPSKSHPATMFNGHAAERLHKLGAFCSWAQPGRLLHAKTCAIDQAVVWIGSGNITAAAATYNHEAYLRVESVEFAARLRAQWRAAGFLGA